MTATKVAKWTETATADNAASTATRAAETGKAHYITSIHASFSTLQTDGRLLTLKDGTTVIANFYVLGNIDPVIVKPIRITDGALAELSLAASGTSTQIGAVTISGFTIG